VTRGWLGVGIQELNQELAASFKLNEPVGALVASVEPGSPAAVAGLKPGDVIRRYDGKAIIDAGDLPPQVAATPPGHDAALEVWRNGKSLGIDITVALLPDRIAHKG